MQGPRLLVLLPMLAGLAATGLVHADIPPNAYVIYRVYLPEGGAGKVALPSLNFSWNDGRPPVQVNPCKVPLDLTQGGLANVANGLPGCAWAFTSGGPGPAIGGNIAYPDTSAVYWLTPFTIDSALTITVQGQYPDARYMSLNVYTAALSSFTSNGVPSALADFQLRPDAGAANPWQQPALAGGRFTVRVANGVQPGDTNALPMPPLVPRNTGGLPPTCSGSACPPQNQFVRAAGGGLLPNVDNAYVAALTQPWPGQVLVVRGKLPAVPSGYYSHHPQPWPAAGVQLRYWSICNNLYLPPYPVTSCAADRDISVDAQGYYTVVVGGALDRPANATAANGVEWLENSAALPFLRHLLIVRNLLPKDFANAAQNVPVGGTPANSAAVMQDYYPVLRPCARALFERGGWRACWK